MFYPVPAKNKMLVDPAVFKKVDHHLFPKKKLIEWRGKKHVVLPLDDFNHAVFLRHEVDAPSPIEHYYDWPGRWKPFKHQVVTAKFLASYQRAWCTNALGCVHPDTKIVTEHGLMRIADITSPTRVLSWNDSSQKFQLSLSSGSFPKGKETLYRVTTRRGEFVATGHHHIACASGEYRRVDQLAPGDRTCSRSLPQTTEGLDQLLSSLDAPSYEQKDVDFAVSYGVAARLCGQQLLKEIDTDLACSPSLDDALRYGMSFSQVACESLESERMGGQTELQLRRTHLDLSSALQSMQGYYYQNEEPELAVGGRAYEQPTGHTLQGLYIQGHTIEPQLPHERLACHHRPRAVDPLDLYGSSYPLESDASSYKISSITSELDEVVSIERVGKHVYYDMHVVGTANYVCDSGIIHHNTGKTMATLWAADYLMSRGLIRSALILSPLSTLERVWGDALFESFHHRSHKVVYGTKKKRLSLLDEPANFYVMNHDAIKIKDIEAKLQGMPIDLVIVDEFAVFRNQTTQNWKALNRLAGPDTQKWLWGLTGAPMPNGPTDLWAQARLINPNLVPRYFARFREQLMVKVTQFKWVPKRGWEAECHKLMKPCIRFTTEQCLDLPDISYITHQCNMSPKQKKIYDGVYKACVAQADEGEILALNEAVKLGKLLQVATGAVYTSEGKIVDLQAKEKLKTLIELIEESGKKAIVFVPYKHSLGVLESEIKKHYSVGVVSGDVAKGKRDTIFQEFQQGDLEVLLAHPQCMAHGLTLTASHTIIWYAPIDNFEYYEQANGRIRRAGQTKHQNVIHLQCSDIERRVYDRLKNKEKVQGVLLDLLKYS